MHSTSQTSIPAQPGQSSRKISSQLLNPSAVSIMNPNQASIPNKVQPALPTLCPTSLIHSSPHIPASRPNISPCATPLSPLTDVSQDDISSLNATAVVIQAVKKKKPKKAPKKATASKVYLKEDIRPSKVITKSGRVVKKVEKLEPKTVSRSSIF